MLPHWLSLFHDELHVFIQPQRIELWRLRGVRGFKPQLMDSKIVSFQTEAGVTSPDDWQLIVTQLQTILKGERWQASMAKVTLSSHFMRYAVIPWNSEIRTMDERQAYLNHHFVMTYGDVVKNWNMRMDVAGYKKSVLASAMPEPLLLAINESFAQANIKLYAVYPYLMRAINHVLETDKFIENCWLALVENQRLTLALIEEGEWQVVRSLPLEVDIAAQIETYIQRETMLGNVNIKRTENREKYPVLMYWSSSAEFKSIEIKQHHVVNVVGDQHSKNLQAKAKQSAQWVMR